MDRIFVSDGNGDGRPLQSFPRKRESRRSPVDNTIIRQYRGDSRLRGNDGRGAAVAPSAHPELVEGWAAAIPGHSTFPAAFSILQQVQDERKRRRPPTAFLAPRFYKKAMELLHPGKKVLTGRQQTGNIRAINPPYTAVKRF